MTQPRRILWLAAFAAGVLFSLPARATAQIGDNEGLLVPGNPPLTSVLLHTETESLEWLLGVKLTPQQRAELKAGMVDAWKSRRQDDIDGYVNFPKLRDQYAQKTAQEQDIILEGARFQLVQRARETQAEPFSRWFVGVYDSAHPPIAAGNPPLTAQAADAYADMIAFIINDTAHRNALQPNRQFKDLVTRVVSSQYATYSADQQKSIAQMPFFCKALSYLWPRLTEPQRNTLRQQWAPMVADLTSGAPSGGFPAASNGNLSAEEQQWYARKTEHIALQPMFQSSFNSTLSLHLNTFNH